MTISQVAKKFHGAFSDDQSLVLAEVITEAVEEAQKELVKAKDFNELKEIVRTLAEAQQELTEAQKKTESAMQELAHAQERTEKKVEQLSEAQKKTESAMQELAYAMKDTHQELAGLAKSVGYSLENEAFRALPLFMKDLYNVELSEKLIRTEIEGKEINIFAKGKKDGQDVIVVGEATLRLDKSNRDKFVQLENAVRLVTKNYPGWTIIPLMITHFATNNILQMAKDKGVIVVQSFEWA